MSSDVARAMIECKTAVEQAAEARARLVIAGAIPRRARRIKGDQG